MAVRKWTWMAGLVVGILACNVRAALWMALDMDSLTDRSQMVVEGTIIGAKDVPNGLFEVKVTRVLAGSGVKEGDEVVVEAGEYKKPADGAFRVKDLEAGDELFCFLTQQRAPGLNATPGVWYPPMGGVKLVNKGHVADFSQEENPGPVVAETDEESVKRGQPSVEEYRKMIAASLVEVPRYRAALKEAIARKDSKGLLALLRKRAAAKAGQPWDWDALASETGMALAELHDYAVLDDAMKNPRANPGVQYRAGFATAEGVAYLMQRIDDGKLSAEERVRYLHALPSANQMWKFRPAGFLVGMAHQAVANKGDWELSRSFMEVVQGWAGQKTVVDGGGLADLMEAAKVLRDYYPTVKDAQVQEEIEKTIWNVDRGMYKELGSECGPIVSRAYIPGDLRNYMPAKGRDLVVSFSTSGCFSEDGNCMVDIEPAMKGADGVEHAGRFVVSPEGGWNPSTQLMGAGSSGGFTSEVEPPADLPAGKYQLYLRFSEGGKYLGRSHGVEVTVGKI